MTLLRADADEVGEGGELELLHLRDGHPAGIEMQRPEELQRSQVPKPSIGDAGPGQVQGDQAGQTWALTKGMREKGEGRGRREGAGVQPYT